MQPLSLLEEVQIRTALFLHDGLATKARDLTGPTSFTALIQEALKVLVERKSAVGLVQFGSEPDLGRQPHCRTDTP